jgi:hypothetical protein
MSRATSLKEEEEQEDKETNKAEERQLSRRRILAKLGIEIQEPKDKEELASEADKSGDQQELMQPAAADSVIIEEIPAEN